MSQDNFTKAKIVFGSNNNNRLIVAQEIANERGGYVTYKSNLFKHFGKSPFSFSDCTENTKTIIITGCPKDFIYELFFNPIVQGITVNKRDIHEFEISPLFVFESEYAPNLIGASFTLRFEIIDMSPLDSNLFQD